SQAGDYVPSQQRIVYWVQQEIGITRQAAQCSRERGELSRAPAAIDHYLRSLRHKRTHPGAVAAQHHYRLGQTSAVGQRERQRGAFAEAGEGLGKTESRRSGRQNDGMDAVHDSQRLMLCEGTFQLTLQWHFTQTPAVAVTCVTSRLLKPRPSAGHNDRGCQLGCVAH